MDDFSEMQLYSLAQSFLDLKENLINYKRIMPGFVKSVPYCKKKIETFGINSSTD